jgi:type I restriction enzyme S subunit
MPAKNSYLPEGWIWSTFGNTFNVFVGATPSRKLPEYWEGNIAWVSSGEVAFCEIHTTRETITQLGLENTSTEVHPPGTILLGMIGEGKTRGQAAILEIAAAHNQNSAAIRVSEAGLPPKFVYYFLKHEYERTRQIGSGNNQPALNKSRVQSITFPLPPLNEQRRIVAKIEALKARSQRVKEELKAIPALLDQFSQSVLAAAFRGDLTADWREKNLDVEPASVLLERIRAERRRRWEEAELEKMKAQGKMPQDDKWKEKYREPEPINADDELPEMPCGWVLVRLEHLSDIHHGYAFKSEDFGDSGPIVLTPGNFTEYGELDFINKRVVRLSKSYDAQWILKNGDLLIVMTDLSQKKLILGSITILNTEETVLHNQRIGLIEPHSHEVTRAYLRYSIISPTFKRYIDRTASGSLITHTSPTKLLNGLLPIAPVAEQVEIVKRLDAAILFTENVRQYVTQALDRFDQIDRSILAKAFRGELVPQDPNDEPASVLLERIRAEREKLDTKKKVKGTTEKKSRKAKPEPAEPEQLSLPGFE